MDIRIESNIGLDLMSIDCIQKLLLRVRDTYPQASLLMIRCNQKYIDEFKTEISLTLFDRDNTERLSSLDRNPHGLLSSLLNELISLREKKQLPVFTPIRSLIPTGVAG